MQKAKAVNEQWMGMEERGGVFCFACGITEAHMGRLNPLGSIFSRSEKLESSRKKHKERTKGSTYQLQQGTFWAKLKKMFFLQW